MKAIALICILAVVGYIGYDDFKRDGLAFRFAGNAALINNAAQLKVLRNDPPTNPQATVLMIGDSHSGVLRPALASALANAHGTSFTAYGNGGCPPLFDVESYYGPAKNMRDCADMAKGLAFAESSATVRTVVMVNRGNLYVTASGFGKTEQHTVTALLRSGQPPDAMAAAHSAEVYESALRITFARLIAKGKRIVFVLDNPELDFSPSACLARPFHLYKVQTPCAVARQTFEVRSRQYRDIVARVAKDFPQVQIFDAAAPLCDAQWCWAMKDGTLFYRDNNHLSVAGAEYIAHALAPLILQK